MYYAHAYAQAVAVWPSVGGGCNAWVEDRAWSMGVCVGGVYLQRAWEYGMCVGHGWGGRERMVWA